MSESQVSAHEEPQEIPRGQKLFDNWILLLLLSLAISGVLYNAWGLIELFTLPPSPIR
jgi:hypothetical protein